MDVTGLLLISAFVIFVVLIAFLFCRGLLGNWQREVAGNVTNPGNVTRPKFPTPSLIIYPSEENRKTKLESQKELETYGWVSREEKVVRIPIEHAMGLLLERGLPEVGAGQTRLRLLQSRPETTIVPNESNPSPSPEGTP